MDAQPTGSGAYIFDTDGIDEMLNRAEGSQDEQNMDEEAHDMVRSWDMSRLCKEASEDQDKFLVDRGTFESTYYEGDQEFEELKTEMEEAVKDILWIKKEKANPDGKEILASSTIQFDRTGHLEFNPIPFESTIHDGKPTITSLNEGLMPGLVQGLLFLREGESAHLLISPRMMFGALGAPPLIPPHAYILYYVRIHKVWDGSDLDAMCRYARDQYLEVPLKDKLELSAQHKDVANQYLADNKPREALVRYKAAIKWIAESPEEEIQQSPESKRLLAILWQNTSITLNRLEMYKSATKAAKQALGIDPSNVKAIYQLAKARIELGDHARALTILNHGMKVAPNNESLHHLRSRLDVQLRDEKLKRDEIMLKMSKACF